MSRDSSPPKIPLRLLRWFCKEELLEDVEGDLSELFADRYATDPAKAKIKFIQDVLMLFRPGIVRGIHIPNRIIHQAMVKNFLKIAFRNAIRYKGYTLLNLLGLVVGIAASMLIILWISYERGVDQFHQKGDQIYQVFRNMNQSNGMVATSSAIPKPAADLVAAEYPQVEEVVLMSWSLDFQIALGDQNMEEEGHYVSPNFLETFSFELVESDGEDMLHAPQTMVISERLAKKHFKEDWKTSIGQTLRVDDSYLSTSEDVKIVGIFKDIPDNSTLQFDFLLPIEPFVRQSSWVDNWGNGSFQTFLVISDPKNSEVVADRIFDEINTHTQDNDLAGDETLILHRFDKKYLYSNFENGVIAGGRIDYVRMMTIIASFLLLIACINFMNLSTARSARRSKEIGLRKVMGARKGSISSQFFLEAMLLTGLAVILSVGVVLLLLPYFNTLVGLELKLDLSAGITWVFLGGLTLILGALSGLYPALLLPTYGITDAIKGGVKRSKTSTYFRKGLVVFQFTISTLLIIGTTIIYQQMNYVLSKDLGLDKENVIAVMMNADLPKRIPSYKAELLRLPEVQSVTVATGNPINYGRSTSSANWTGRDPNAGHEINVIIVDEDFVQTMGMKIVAGRDFTSQLNDSTNFLINEVAAELMGFENPIEQKLSFWGIEGNIVGVVKNFHMRDMHRPIAPLIITCFDPSDAYLALVKISGDTPKVLASIEEVTDSFTPEYEFDYAFLDDLYARQYRDEQLISRLAAIFAVMSIFISCLGLFGLASYSAEQRSREIGIRKVHGARVQQILLLLSGDYSKLMVLSFLISIPFAFYAARSWLEGFEFRVEINPLLFLLGGLVTFVIAILTVVSKSYQVATLNPVKSLKDE
ncbi:MAG: ABC transporter permease [Bacteroidota bacterium]